MDELAAAAVAGTAGGDGPYEEQLAARVAELLPDLASAERLGLLGAMDPAR